MKVLFSFFDFVFQVSVFHKDCKLIIAVEEKMSFEDDSAEDSAVQDFLQILEEHRKNCERQGKYVEAEIAKNRLEELKLHEENRRREAMRSRQIAERLGVEEAHMLEFQQFNIVWDKKMQDYEERAAMLEEETKARHAQELANFQKHMIESISNKPKFSKELLNLRRVQETLAKAKDYKEAHRYVFYIYRLLSTTGKLRLDIGCFGQPNKHTDEQHKK